MSMQPPPGGRERRLLVVLGAAGLTGLAALAWQAVGWFGVGVLGLLVTFIAVRVDLEDDRPIGPQMTPDLHASQFRGEGATGRSERAGRAHERFAVRSAARLAMLFGLALIAVGFGLFWLL